MSYAAFLEQKRRIVQPIGPTVRSGDVQDALFPFQRALVAWAVRKGRAALWCDCGLGKTPMQLEWARLIGQRTLILAPLCVAEQTVREGVKFGIPVKYARYAEDIGDAPIVVTNYERLDLFDASAFQAVVLDESSILKAFDGKTRTKLIQTFARTPYRLCCTATPAPNDIAELANHAEFLGLLTRAEFLATWFVHDDAGWRMKRHAVQPFYRWLASWAVAIRKPSDLGFADTGFVLPPLRIHDLIVEGTGIDGVLFPELGLHGLTGRLAARRSSLEARICAAANLIDEWGASWIAWCGLNPESAALSKELINAVEVCGDDTYAEKAAAVLGFCDRSIKVLVSKVRILGYGLNFQHCHKMVFVGLGDSYEQYYQAIRRCWRFGQACPVDVHIVVSDPERAIVENVRRKEATAAELSAELLTHLRDFEAEEIAV